MGYRGAAREDLVKVTTGPPTEDPHLFFSSRISVMKYTRGGGAHRTVVTTHSAAQAAMSQTSRRLQCLRHPAAAYFMEKGTRPCLHTFCQVSAGLQFLRASIGLMSLPPPPSILLSMATTATAFFLQAITLALAILRCVSLSVLWMQVLALFSRHNFLVVDPPPPPIFSPLLGTSS